MKKLFAVVAIVAVALTSCVKNEVITPDGEITFKAVNYKNTKAYVHGTIEDVIYPNAESFGVFAYPSNNITEDYMENVEISKQGSVWKNDARNYYWPKDGVSLTFAAYSPYHFEGAGVVTATAAQGIKIAGYTTNNDLTKQVDLMVADVIRGKTSGPVAVPFKHTLSALKFKVAPKEAGYTIERITLNKVSFKVACTADYASTDGTFANSAWTNRSGEMVYSVINGEYVVDLNNTNMQSFGVPVIVIPQGAVDITVDYTIDYGFGHVEVCNAVYHPNGATWNKNTIYTYNLTIGLDEILFEPTVEAWDYVNDLAWEANN